MKLLSVVVGVMLLSRSGFAQRDIAIRQLWIRPQISVTFNGYQLLFTIRDINRAIELLNEGNDYTYGTKCDLDTSKSYSLELYNDLHTEYKSDLQPLLQNGVGAFLLSKGLAVIYNQKHKKLKNILMEIEDSENGESTVYLHFFDPKKHQLLFTGKVSMDLYGKDMGIDYY